MLNFVVTKFIKIVYTVYNNIEIKKSISFKVLSVVLF